MRFGTFLCTLIKSITDCSHYLQFGMQSMKSTKVINNNYDNKVMNWFMTVKSNMNVVSVFRCQSVDDDNEIIDEVVNVQFSSVHHMPSSNGAAVNTIYSVVSVSVSSAWCLLYSYNMLSGGHILLHTVHQLPVRHVIITHFIILSNSLACWMLIYILIIKLI